MNGSNEWMDDLWEMYPSLLRRVAVIVRDPEEAQDLAQAAIVRAMEAWEPGQIRDVRAWLNTIATRLALNEVRRRRRWRFSPQAEEPPVELGETDADLWAALGELNRHERAVIVMQVLEGYSHAEIAQRLGIPSGTVSSWLSRGKTKLRLRLRSEDDSSGQLRQRATEPLE